ALGMALLPLAHDRYLIGTLTEVLIFGLFAMSLGLLVGFTGLVSLGHAAFFGTAAYAVGLVSTRVSPALLLTLPAGIAAGTLAAAILLSRIVASPFGAALVGIRENEPRMRAMGFDTFRLKLGAFVLAGAAAALSGALYAYYNGFVSPDDLYWTRSGEVLVMVLLGGAGTLLGPAVGAAAVLVL